jgi:hypothetical protein
MQHVREKTTIFAGQRFHNRLKVSLFNDLANGILRRMQKCTVARVTVGRTRCHQDSELFAHPPQLIDVTNDILPTFAISVPLHFHHSIGQRVIERLKIVYIKIAIRLFISEPLGGFDKSKSGSIAIASIPRTAGINDISSRSIIFGWPSGID